MDQIVEHFVRYEHTCCTVFFIRNSWCTDLEWFLFQKGIITDSELEEDPKLSSTSGSASKPKFTMSSGTVFRATNAALDSDDDNFDD